MREHGVDQTTNIQGGRPRGGSSGPVRFQPANIVETWVDEHGGYLFGYVLPRVRERDIAEDLVQETFLAAVKAVDSFRGDSSPRTWLVGLLRRKIADHYRKRSREPVTESIDTADPAIDAWFDQKGSWEKWPSQFAVEPADLERSAGFWPVMQCCLGALPERLAAAFTLRVMDGRRPEEVCKILSITPTNLWVTLHRARARLRACLEANWFGSKADKGERKD